MADHIKSITERVNVFGVAPSTKWNEFLWGVGKWGEGSSDVIKDFQKVLDPDLVLSADTHSNEIDKLIQDSEFILMEMTDTKLTDSKGYSYVFPGGTTDAEDQTHTDWVEGVHSDPAWVSGTVRGTSWS